MRFIELYITCCTLLLIGGWDFTQGSPSPQLSQILDTLLKNYDKRVHPFHGNEPVMVGLTMYLLSLTINDVERQFTCSLYMRQTWKDDRLKFNTTDENKNATIELHREDWDKIWMPDTFLVNEVNSFVHEVTVPNNLVRISPSGSILQSQRVTVTAGCAMAFAYFPFDSQVCSLEIESYAKNTTQLKYAWARGNESVGIALHNIDTVFELIGYLPKQLDASLSSGNYSRMYFEFGLRRNWYGYKNTFFYPMIIFSCLSLVTIWIAQYKIGTFVNLINVIGVLNIFMALFCIGSDYIKRKGAQSTALDSYFCFTNSIAVMCFLVNVINLCLESRKTSNAQGIEMSRLRTEVNDGNDIESRNRRGSEESRRHIWDAFPASTREITPERIRVLCEMIIVKICFRFSHWIITAVYIVYNIYYWSFYSTRKIDLNENVYGWVIPNED